jgi:hypothetical protein
MFSFKSTHTTNPPLATLRTQICLTSVYKHDVKYSYHKFSTSDQPRGLMVRTSDYFPWGPEFEYRFFCGNFSLQRKIPIATMVWVVCRIIFKALSGTPRSYIYNHLHHRGNVTAPQPQTSVPLRPQPGRGTTKSISTCGGKETKIIQVLNTTDRAMAQAIRGRPLNSEACARSKASLCRVCGRKGTMVQHFSFPFSVLLHWISIIF